MVKTQQIADISDEDVYPLGEFEYEVVDSVKLDVSLIPDHVRDEFAAAALEFVRNIIRQPGGREMLRANAEKRKMREAAEAAKIAAKSAALKGANV